MLGKLLKYEIPALGRKLIPLYIGWCATAALLGVAVGPLESKSEFFIVISTLLYTAAATAVLVMAIVLIIQRYSNSLLGEEGYFNHVLPVTASEHIASKGISAMIWIFLSGIAMIVTGLIIAVFSGAVLHIFDVNWTELFHEIFSHLGFKEVIFLLEVLILGVVSITKSVLAIYAAITVGHQAEKRTTLVSIAAYIGLMIFETTVTRILLGIFPNLFTEFDGLEGFHVIFLGVVLVLAALSALYFFLCKFLMEKRLNLN